MKKIFSLIFLWFFLVWCFSNTDSDGLVFYNDNENFSLKIPENWEVIENTTWVLPKPRSWEIEFAVKSKIEKEGFLNNLVVLSENLKSEISASSFVKSTTINSENDYFEYEKIEDKNFVFENGDSTNIVIFNARYDEKTPKLKFIQTANICKNRAFLITLAISSSVEDTSRYEKMLSSFSCKE